MTRVALTQLNEHECWALLAAHRPRLGRIGFTDEGATVVYPMNFAIARRTLYLRTDPASKLSVAVDSQQVAFEVDHVDQSWEQGWSVLVQGRLTPVTDPDELERHRELVLRTWAPGDRLHLLRLDASRISGRRIR